MFKSVLAKSAFVLPVALTMLPMTAHAATTATTQHPSSNKVLIDKVVNGERVYWTQADEDAANQRRAQEDAIINGTSTTSSNATSAAITPNSVPGAPPSAASSVIGTGDYSSSDYLQDSSESTAAGVKDSHLILENAAGSTCGPIAAHNLLTHFGAALNYTQLEPKVGYSNGQTPWSSQYATGLNGQESSYTYTAFTEMSSTQSYWDDAFIRLAVAVGTSDVPTAVNTNGYLPQFGHSLGHFWVGFGYNGYGQSSPSNKTIDYFDSSQEHPGSYWFQQTESTFIGNNCSIYGIVG